MQNSRLATVFTGGPEVSFMPSIHRSRTRRPATTGRLLAAILVLGLGACAGQNLAGVFGGRTLPPDCPDVRILSDAATHTRFADGDGRDLTDIVAEARLDGFQANCREKIDARTKSREVTLELAAIFDVIRGPASTGNAATFQYFVAITDLDRNVLGKEVFDLPVSFERNSFRSTVQDTSVVLLIPMAPSDSGSSYLVYLGLQLSDRDLDHNRKIGPALLGS